MGKEEEEKLAKKRSWNSVDWSNQCFEMCFYVVILLKLARIELVPLATFNNVIWLVTFFEKVEESQ